MGWYNIKIHVCSFFTKVVYTKSVVSSGIANFKVIQEVNLNNKNDNNNNSFNFASKVQRLVKMNKYTMFSTCFPIFDCLFDLLLYFIVNSYGHVCMLPSLYGTSTQRWV